ncbi:hypothetical protein STBA_36890 [Streptomyces sp. MP131-18]|nr:hypothetical protein STBA_36890 [Streptomyces sp. MP131-18]
MSCCQYVTIADSSMTTSSSGRGVATLSVSSMWKETSMDVDRWDRFHYVRVAVIIAAFALLAAALARA